MQKKLQNVILCGILKFSIVFSDCKSNIHGDTEGR